MNHNLLLGSKVGLNFSVYIWAVVRNDFLGESFEFLTEIGAFTLSSKLTSFGNKASLHGRVILKQYKKLISRTFVFDNAAFTPAGDPL